MMFAALLASALTATAGECPAAPLLRDPDDHVTALSQNLKFIATGGHKVARAELLAEYLAVHPEVDLLLLSEARSLGPLRAGLRGWCFYTQVGHPLAYRWAAGDLSPGGLVLAVRQRSSGEPRHLSAEAGRVFRARPVTLAEGFLGKIAGFEKGWAVAHVDGTSMVWTHTQASYASSPLRGAGGPGAGREGQFADLAADLGHAEHPVLLTGDLNVLDGAPSPDGGVQAAGRRDARTLSGFSALTGIRFGSAGDPCPGGSFLGALRGVADSVFVGATFDRVGTNGAFDAQHVGAQFGCERIEGEGLRLSDHLGVRIHAPFGASPVYTLGP